MALQAAAVERPDMTGFSLAHPIDAMPDMFVPGHLIESEIKRYRGLLRVKRSSVLKVNGTSKAKTKPSKKVIPPAKIDKRMGAAVLSTVLPNRTALLTSSKLSVKMEKGQIIRVKSNSTKKVDLGLKLGKSGLSNKVRKGDDENDDESDEDDEVDDDYDEDSEERENRRKKKHPLGYGHGFVGDGFGSYKKRQPSGYGGGGGGSGGGGGGGNGGPFGGLVGWGDRGKEKDKDNNKKKGKGKGKGKGKKKDKDKKKCIIVDGSVGLDNGIENKLWYWREDMMVNQHHWYECNF